jgi:hypothetical protein
MTSMSWLFESAAAPRSSAGEIIRDHRARIALEERERAERRRLELAEQQSDLSSPETRIRTWEKVHELRLPTDPDHPILDVIAVATRLTIEQVREEQDARAAARRRVAAQPR